MSYFEYLKQSWELVAVGAVLGALISGIVWLIASHFWTPRVWPVKFAKAEGNRVVMTLIPNGWAIPLEIVRDDEIMSTMAMSSSYAILVDKLDRYRGVYRPHPIDSGHPWAMSILHLAGTLSLIPGVSGNFEQNPRQLEFARGRMWDFVAYLMHSS